VNGAQAAVDADPLLALERLHGDSVARQIVKQAIEERNVLMRELHCFRQDHRTIAAEIIAESLAKIERCLKHLKQPAQDAADHG
jgi:hypothetical protein